MHWGMVPCVGETFCHQSSQPQALSASQADPLHDLLPDEDCIQSSEWIAYDVSQDWFSTLFTNQTHWC